jgi:hypothetical protein
MQLSCALPRSWPGLRRSSRLGQVGRDKLTSE